MLYGNMVGVCQIVDLKLVEVLNLLDVFRGQVLVRGYLELFNFRNKNSQV